MSQLALYGGQKVRKEKFPAYITIDEGEIQNVLKVFNSNSFSRFLGAWHNDFYGGQQVLAFEKAWADYFRVKYAVSLNSATSALYSAVGALGIEPFDEIIVTPYSMSCSATAPLIYNAIPVFADVESDYFCLDPESVERCITDRTKAIIVVDLFGQPYNEMLFKIARKHNLKIIEDCSQAPYARVSNKFAGTLADIGLYSLNYHKHIHCGEGGIAVTNDSELANKLQLIRNHAEAVVESKGETDLVNMIGYNYRMTEIEAAIGFEQIKKLSALNEKRVNNVLYLEQRLKNIPCLIMPKIRENCTHAYYMHAILFDEALAGIHRNTYVEALRAELMPIELRETEGIKIGCGYVKPIYLQPLFQNKIAYGSHGFPWSMSGREYNYQKGICPVVEDLYYNKLITHEYIHPNMTHADLDDVATAFEKVWDNRDELIARENRR